MEHRPRVVIIGGGFGGLRTALLLSRQRMPLEIILVDANDVHVYTPWLYEVASGRTDGVSERHRRRLRHSASFPFIDILRGTNVMFRKAVLKNVDAERRHVLFADGSTLAFDSLVLAVGSESAIFGIPGLERHALQLKTVTDAIAIENNITSQLKNDNALHIFVAGAGSSGVELVAELATMVGARQRRGSLPKGEVKFSLVDAASSVLSMCSHGVQVATLRRLQKLGITVLLDTMVTKVAEDMVTLAPRQRLPLSSSREVPYTCFVWCGGVAPNHVTLALPFTKDARGRIAVDVSFEILGHANIFALGDAVAMADFDLPATAQAADETAKTVAENVVRGLRRRALKKYVPPRRWPFVVAVGGAYGVADVFGLTLTGWPAYALRRLADLRYCVRTFRFFTALRVWRLRMKFYGKND